MLNNSEKFQHVVSIGSNCMTAYLTRRLDLRRYAGPFDWVFCNPNLVLSCINDEFREYLDPQNFVNDGSDTAWGHKTYMERYGQRRTFNHHNVQNQADYEHFLRCVARFQSLRSCDSRVMLTLNLPAGFLENEHVQSDLLAIAGSFKDAKILLIGLTAEGPRNVEYRAKTDRMDVYAVTPSAACTNGLWFEADADNALLDFVMNEYVYDLVGDPTG